MDPNFKLTRDHDLFCGFLLHLVREEDFTAEQLLDVVERPDRWTPEFLKWLPGSSGVDIWPIDLWS
jgi:hypothetical protein